VGHIVYSLLDLSPYLSLPPTSLPLENVAPQWFQTCYQHQGWMPRAQSRFPPTTTRRRGWMPGAA
jgi:hypothetical protein